MDQWLLDTRIAELLSLDKMFWFYPLVFLFAWGCFGFLFKKSKQNFLYAFFVSCGFMLLFAGLAHLPSKDQIGHGISNVVEFTQTQAKDLKESDVGDSVANAVKQTKDSKESDVESSSMSFWTSKTFWSVVLVLFIGVLVIRRVKSTSKFSTPSMIGLVFLVISIWSRKGSWSDSSLLISTLDMIPVILGIVIIVMSKRRIDRAFEEGQWLSVYDPIYQVRSYFNVSSFWLVFWSFVGFQATILTVIAAYHWFSTTMWLVILAMFAVSHVLGIWIKLPPAHMMVWRIFEADRYHPFFYLWRKEKENKGSAYLHRENEGAPREVKWPIEKGVRARGFHKGLSFGWFALWWPFIECYVFPDEEIEVDTFELRALSTKPREVEKKDSKGNTVIGDDGQPEMVKEDAGPEVTLHMTMVLFKYLFPKQFLVLALRDRKDEVGFIKRQFEPMINRCLGFLTIDEVVGEKKLADTATEFTIDEQTGNLRQLWQAKMLIQMGYGVKTVSASDQDQSEELKRAQEDLRIQESLNKLADLKIQQKKKEGEAQIAELLTIVNGLAESRAAGDEVTAQDRKEAIDKWIMLNMVEGDNKTFLPLPVGLLNSLGSIAA